MNEWIRGNWESVGADVISSLNNGPVASVDGSYDATTRKATANLIATAPALVAALEAGVKLAGEVVELFKHEDLPPAMHMMLARLDDWQADAQVDALALVKGEK